MDRSYRIRRAVEELAAAERAKSPQAALVHRELARLYRESIDGEPSQDRSRNMRTPQLA